MNRKATSRKERKAIRQASGGVIERLETRMLLAVSPVGPEFRVNTYTADNPSSPSVAMNTAGDSVVSWNKHGQDGSALGIYAQRYNALGVAQGNEFRVTYTADNQSSPSVAMDTAGDFVVSWNSLGQDGSYAFGIYAQRYNALGVAQGTEFQVNTYTTNDQSSPSVAMDAAGDFVVSWESSGQDGSGSGVYAQRYNALGVAQGGEFRVNTYTQNTQGSPSVAMDAAGDFVVSWESRYHAGSDFGIYAQRYNVLGIARGSEFRVNTSTAGDQLNPSVAMDAAGDFVVSWYSYGYDLVGQGIYAQRYNAGGITQGSEFRVNTYHFYGESVSSVAMDSAGDFVVSWGSRDGSGFGIYAQRYNALGVAQGNEFRVNTYTPGHQYGPSVAMDAVGDFVVSWHSRQGSDYDIYAQRYATATTQLSASSGDDTILLRRNGNNLELFRQNPPVGTPAISQLVDAAPSLTLDLLGGDDKIIIDFTGGNPIPAGGLFLDAGGGVNTLSFVGNIIGPASGNINITGGTMDIISDPNGGSLALSETAAVRFTTSAHLASLSLADNAKLTFAAPAQFLRAAGLGISSNATLDLGDDSLIVDATAQNRAALLATLGGLLNSGRNGGSWSGKGITSSSAASDPNHLTTLAALLNDRGDGSPLYANFAGETVDNNAILLKKTLNGDTDLNGKIDADDYFNIDRGFSQKRIGWQNGDFDYSGSVDADDYFLIDKSFLSQPHAVPAAPFSAASPASAAATDATDSGAVAAAADDPSRKRQRHPRHHRRDSFDGLFAKVSQP
jgi:hypothetical protein